MLGTVSDYRVMVDDPKSTIGLNEDLFGLVAPFWLMDSFAAVIGQRQAGEEELYDGSFVVLQNIALSNERQRFLFD